MNKYDKAVQEAEKLLIKKSRDKSHDFKHHDDVWRLCELILQTEKLKINKELLKVATFWHDVVVGEEKWPSKLMVEETCNHLLKLLPTLRFGKEEINNITETILHHEFRDTPTTTEGLVLQDADKLDALSLVRWEQTYEDYKKGRTKKENLQSYMRTVLKWLAILGSTFHYKYSRDRAEKVIEDFWRDIKWKNVFEDFGLENEYKLAEEERDSVKTKLLRLFIRTKNLTTRYRLLLK